MRQHQTVDAYIQEVQQNIRWKRARKIATIELELHIQDQIEALVLKGYDYDQALSVALAAMGEPDKIGQELDAVYRPKLNLPVIGLTAAFLIIGIFVNLFTGAAFPITRVFAIVLGIVLAVGLYWCDYTLLLRYPRIFYWSHVILTIGVLIYESRNGFFLVSYSYTFYLLLLFPITLTGVALYFNKKETPLDFFCFILYAFVPLTISVLTTSAQAFILLTISIVIIVIFGVRKHWFNFTRVSLGITLCLIVTVGISLFYTCYLLNIHFLFARSSVFIQDTVRSALSGVSMFGDPSFVLQNDIGQLIMTGYPIAVLLLRYGYIPTGILLISFAALLTFLYKIALKQKVEIIRVLSLIICSIITLQFVCAVFSNIGISGDFSMCFPFIVSGGILTTYNLVLIGIMLSITRHEDIVKDWISYQSRGALYA